VSTDLFLGILPGLAHRTKQHPPVRHPAPPAAPTGRVHRAADRRSARRRIRDRWWFV